jgi:hypothetical protein
LARAWNRTTIAKFSLPKSVKHTVVCRLFFYIRMIFYDIIRWKFQITSVIINEYDITIPKKLETSACVNLYQISVSVFSIVTFEKV